MRPSSPLPLSAHPLPYVHFLTWQRRAEDDCLGSEPRVSWLALQMALGMVEENGNGRCPIPAQGCLALFVEERLDFSPRRQGAGRQDGLGPSSCLVAAKTASRGFQKHQQRWGCVDVEEAGCLVYGTTGDAVLASPSGLLSLGSK